MEVKRLERPAEEGILLGNLPMGAVFERLDALYKPQNVQNVFQKLDERDGPNCYCSRLQSGKTQLLNEKLRVRELCGVWTETPF